MSTRKTRIFAQVKEVDVSDEGIVITFHNRQKAFFDAQDVIVTFADGQTVRYPLTLLREMIPETLPIPGLDPEPED